MIDDLNGPRCGGGALRRHFCDSSEVSHAMRASTAAMPPDKVD
jgi:hypothetical protein